MSIRRSAHQQQHQQRYQQHQYHEKRAYLADCLCEKTPQNLVTLHVKISKVRQDTLIAKELRLSSI